MVKVITYTTPDFKKYSLQLEKDCLKFNIDYFNYDVEPPDDFFELMKLKLKLIKKTLKHTDKVLYVDVESRILKPFPNWWYDCEFLVAKKENKKSVSSTAFANSGFIWVDKKRIDLIEKSLEIDSYITNTTSITQKAWCDDIISIITLNNLDKIKTTKLNYNRFSKGEYELVRGNWKDQHTVIQHPTNNVWLDNRDFYNQATSGTFTLVNHMKNLTIDLLENLANLMIETSDDIDRWEEIGASVHEKVDGRNVFCINDWVFDPKDNRYSPLEYFNIKRKMFRQDDYNFIKNYVKVANS